MVLPALDAMDRSTVYDLAVNREEVSWLRLVLHRQKRTL